MKVLPKRKPNRLKNYDYNLESAYFITICTKNSECLFGEIINSEMQLNEWGKLVKQNIDMMKTTVEIDHYCIMPNHVHMILCTYAECVQHTPYDGKSKDRTKMKIPVIIQQFKSSVTKSIRRRERILCVPLDNSYTPSTVWQKSYHDHIIRNKKSYAQIAEYIENNHRNWNADCFHNDGTHKMRSLQ